MNTAVAPSTTSAPTDTRSTSLDTLSVPPSALSTASPASTASTSTMASQQLPSDSELVNDILQEIQQSNAATGGGVVDANTVHQQQQTNDSAFARQMDPNLTHEMPPTSADQLRTYATSEQTGMATSAATSATHDTDLARTLAAAQPVSSGSASDEAGWFGFLGNLDIIQYAKTILLFMIVYIVVSNSTVQSLLCKVPFCGVAPAIDAVATPQMSFLGNVGVALVAGILMATVQATV